MKKDCWKRLGRAAVGVLALVVCPAASQAGGGVVALQTADPSCSNDSGDIYVDCRNGTVTDTRTGLVWLRDSTCTGQLDWYQAMEFVAGLSDLDQSVCTANNLNSAECDCNLTDGSSPGEWRLPSADEWQVMVSDAVDVGCTPTITDATGTDCWPCVLPDLGCTGSGIIGVRASDYWSSSIFTDSPEGAWEVHLADGVLEGDIKSDGPGYVWPVRGGQ